MVYAFGTRRAGSISAYWVIWVALCLAIAVPAIAVADEQTEEIPENEPGVSTIDAQQLVDMMTTVEQLTVIDARIAKGRRKGHIESSIHLPDIDTNCLTLERAVPTKTANIVFYCSSNKCGRSLNSVRIAKSCGYTNVFWFRGGFEEWKASRLPYQK